MRLSPLNGQGPRSRLAICGFGDRAETAPWSDPQWDIWGCNSFPMSTRPALFHDPEGRFRADQWWQIHPLAVLDPRELDWLARLPETHVQTVVLADQVEAILSRWPSVARTDLLPFGAAEVRASFPVGVFASTFCLQIASALQLGYEEIALYGCDCLNLGREIVVERPAVAYWQGVAHATGVKCWFAPPATLGHHPYVYGAEYEAEARFAAAITECVLPSRLIDPTGNLNTVAAIDDALDTRKKTLTPPVSE